MNTSREPTNSGNNNFARLAAIVLVSVVLTLLILFSGLLPVHIQLGNVPTGNSQEVNGFAALFKRFSNQFGDKPTSESATPASQTAQAKSSAKPIVRDELLPEQQNTITLVIPPKQHLSFHIAMERDYALTYQWHTDGKPLYAEFRGERTDGREKLSRTFGDKLNTDKASGFFIVPFIGNFTWYWNNKHDKPVTVLLSMKGAYTILGKE
jgi:hypothetical protein